MENESDRPVEPTTRNTRKPLPRLISLQDAAVETGIPYTSLRDLVMRGELPRVQLPTQRRLWVRRSDVERLIENSVVREAK